jgi:hypothetical protein
MVVLDWNFALIFVHPRLSAIDVWIHSCEKPSIEIKKQLEISILARFSMISTIGSFMRAWWVHQIASAGIVRREYDPAFCKWEMLRIENVMIRVRWQSLF